MESVDWFVPWMPLGQVPLPIRPVAEDIYQVDSQVFILARADNRRLEDDVNGPFAAILYFAPDVQAIERSLRGRVQDDTGAHLDLSTLPSFGIEDWTYGGLSSLCGGMESAQYNLEGKFIQVTLFGNCPKTNGRMQFCFRQRRLAPRHLPYLIAYRGALLPEVS